MEHQYAILHHQLASMKKGIEKAEEYVAGASRLLLCIKELSSEEIENRIEETRNELSEIRDFLLWLSQQ